MALGDPYATTAELKSELRITDADDDTQLALAVEAASEWITSWCERDFNQAATTSVRTFYPSAGIVHVDDIATTTGLVVGVDTGDDGTYETTWTISTDFTLEPVNGVVGGVSGHPFTRIRPTGTLSFPSSLTYRPSVQVTATWGWPAVPSSVKRAALILAARLYKRRDSAEGILGGLGDFGPVRVGTRLDPDVEMLLAAYRKYPVLVA